MQDDSSRDPERQGECRFEAAGSVAVAHRRRTRSAEPDASRIQTCAKSRSPFPTTPPPPWSSATTIRTSRASSARSACPPTPTATRSSSRARRARASRRAACSNCLYERVKMGQPASEGDVEGAIAESAYHGSPVPRRRGNEGHLRRRQDAQARGRAGAQRRSGPLPRRPAQVRAGFRRRARGHRQDLACGRARGVAARAGPGRAADPVAPGGRGGRAARLPAGRHEGEGRPLSAGRSTTRCTISWTGGWSSAASRPA